MSQREALGDAAVVTTSAGPVHLHDTGLAPSREAPTLVLVAGFLANGDVWRPIVPGLVRAGFRVVTLDPPTGSHTQGMNPDADLSPGGLANILGDVIDQLDADDVTIVSNDFGCAVVQLLITGDHPAVVRLDRVVFATGDFFEHFPPEAFEFLGELAQQPSGVLQMVESLGDAEVWDSPIAFGLLTNEPLPQDVRDSFLAGGREHEDVRRDIAKVLAGVDREVTLEAAKHFPQFDRPVLLLWAEDDQFFPPSDADRAAGLFPDASVVKVPRARTFLMWDQPDAVVEAIVGFHGAR